MLLRLRGGRNCRSLHFGRDDKGEGGASIRMNGWPILCILCKGWGQRRSPGAANWQLRIPPFEKRRVGHPGVLFVLR
jgi:hypothetical protein